MDKTNTRKNKPLVIISTLLIMYVITGLALLALALLLFKMQLSENIVSISIMVIYIISCLIGGLVVAAVVAAFSPSGKRFIAFCRESWEELRRVVWPTRKETVNTTGIVMAFVVAVSIYLFLVDKLIEWGLYDGLLQLTF